MLHQSLIYHLQFKCKASKSVIVNAVTIMVSSGKKAWLQRQLKTSVFILYTIKANLGHSQTSMMNLF